MPDIVARFGRLVALVRKAVPIIFAVLLVGVALPDTFGPETEEEKPPQ